MTIRFIQNNFKIKFFLLPLTILLLSAAPSSAQDFWQQLPIYGGGAQNFVIGPGTKLYAYTDFNNTLSMSTNAGDLWTKINIPVEQLSDIHLQTFGVSSDGSILSLWKNSKSDKDSLIIYKSQNDGATWQPIDTLNGSSIGQGMINGAANSLFFLYKPVDFHEYPLRRTTDNGDTWTTIIPDSQAYSLSAIGANTNGWIVASSYDKILLSTDNGDNWTDISGNFPGYGASTIALNDSNHIFVATWENQIFRSRNNGETWETIYQDTSGGTIRQILPNSSGDLLFDLTIYNSGTYEYRLMRLPQFSTTPEIIFSKNNLYSGLFRVDSNDAIFVATTNSIYRSSDNGQTWTEITQGLTHFLTNSFAAASNGDIFFSASGLPLYKSSDRGENWQKVATSYPALDWNHGVVTHNNAIYALADSGVYKSTDLGTSWLRLTPENIYSASYITWDNSGTAYLLSSHNNLYRTTTNEQTWVAMNTDAFSTVDINQIFALPTGTLFVGVDSLSVFRSTDQGNSWTSASTGLPLESAFTFAHDSSGGIIVSVLYDSSDNRYYGGLYRSTNNGVSWQSINNGLPGTAFTSIVVNSAGHIYAANLYDGVYRSTDLGQTWTQVNSGLSGNTTAWKLGLDNDDYLFLATVNGVFRSALSTSTTTPEIVVDVPQEPETGKDLTLSVNKDPNFQATIVRLYYRIPGETEWRFIESATPSDTAFSFVIPADSISYQGLEYYIYLFDGNTNTTVTYPPENPQTNPISLRVRVTSQTAKLTLSPLTYRMVSLPLVLDNPEIGSVLTDDYGEPDAKSWRLLRWVSLGDSGLYLEYPYLQDDFSLGNAFWLITRDGKMFDVDSAWSNNVNEPYSYTLKPGWNQIGNPFPFPVPSDSVQNIQYVEPPVYYDGAQYLYNQKILQPWEGYFVYNSSGQELQISIPPIHAQTTLPKTKSHWQAASEKGFSVRLKAQMRNTKLLDTENFIGISELAKDETDEFDLAEAPPIGEYLQLYALEKGKKFTSNFKSVPQHGQQWQLRLELSEWINFPVDFSIEQNGNLPEGFHVYIFDEHDQCALDISDGKFSINLPKNTLTRNFKLIIGNEEYASAHSNDIPLRPVDYALRQNYPNPFNGATTINYQLAKRSRVKLEIYNILGRKIRTLVDEVQPTGNHKITWDATDNQRRPVSTGVYFYRLEAEKFVAARKLPRENFF
ncbi:MAG: T9SS type A sorting domain-containing protein [Calditrichaeota bacterium]|nr:T9SS type A sorting domain-containing protein [Calditrichota bacterium]